MNRWQGSGLSKATTNTVCQKCLKKGHYSYECTAARQDRPYVARPSRTQQLSNPKLAPKLKDVALKEVVATTSMNDNEKGAQSGKSPAQRNQANADQSQQPRRRNDSISSSDSGSVSTISTDRDASVSRRRDDHDQSKKHEFQRHISRSSSYSRSTSSRRSANARSPRRGRDQTTRPRSPDRVRQPVAKSSATSPSDASRYGNQDERSSRRPEQRLRGSRSRSRSPYRKDRTDHGGAGRERVSRSRDLRQRSLSPYSKRIAMTTGKN